jgi:phosphoribosylanthranilate isomerase
MGVDMIGFTLDENHPRFIELTTARDITNWISGVEVVGEFTGINIPNIDYLAKELNMDYIQVAHPFDLHQTSHLHKPVIMKISYERGHEDAAEHILKTYKDLVKYFLIESESDLKFDEVADLFRKWAAEYPLLIGTGIEISKLDSILQDIRPMGIALKGGDEIKPGLKNFDELSEILEHLESED